jgi:Spy/CpxP family protein refolding chaperone
MGDSPEIRAQKIERMTKSLNLSPEQEAKLTNLFEAQGTKYKAIHEETRKQMETFLTKEQLAKIDAMREKRHHKWEKEHGDLTRAETPPVVK